MAKRVSLTQQLQKGFGKLPQQLDILIILALFELVSTTLPVSTNWLISFAIPLIMLFLFASFVFTIPVFVTQERTIERMAEETAQTLRRLIFPLSVLLISIFFFITLISTAYLVFEKNLIPYLRIIVPLYLLTIAFIYTITSFQGIYFTLEKKGFFTSLKHSFIFSRQHFSFILVIVLINFLDSVFNVTVVRGNVALHLVQAVLTSILYLGFINTALLLYKHK